jgi:hypothetical protein
VSRHVRVRLRPETYEQVERAAASGWKSIAALCRTSVRAHLLGGHVVPVGRVPMPIGVDVDVEFPDELWNEAKDAAKQADMTVGQLARCVMERWARETVHVERPSVQHN